MRSRDPRVVMVALRCMIALLCMVAGRPASASDAPGATPRADPAARGSSPVPALTPGPPVADLVVPDRAARDHVGRHVTIEGRVHGVYVSPLATILAFGPNFSGFTAVIQAVDRSKFPADVAEQTRNGLVRVRGLVTAYRGRPEMRLQDPAQLTLVAPSSAAGATPPSRTADPRDAEPPGARATLARIEARLEALEARVAALEELPQSDPVAAGGSGDVVPRTLAAGMSAAQVRGLLGYPIETRRGMDGGQVWAYEGGRTVALDRRGRVTRWIGF